MAESIAHDFDVSSVETDQLHTEPPLSKGTLVLGALTGILGVYFLIGLFTGVGVNPLMEQCDTFSGIFKVAGLVCFVLLGLPLLLWCLAGTKSRASRAFCCLRGWAVGVMVFLLLVFLVSLVGLAVLTAYSNAFVPRRHGTLELAGLSAPATVERERATGLLHIRAANQRDLYFAQGFVAAQERLWQMDVARRLTSGRLAALVGSSGVSTDRYFRTLGTASLNWERDSESVWMFSRYVEGVNARIQDIESGASPMPYEYSVVPGSLERFDVEDVMYSFALLSFQLDGNSDAEFLRSDLLKLNFTEAQIDNDNPEPPFDTPTVYGGSRRKRRAPRGTGQAPPAYERATVRSHRDAFVASLSPEERRWIAPYLNREASNQWVVAGRHTESGLPYVASDPHLGLTLPSIWLPFHLVVEGDIDLVGVSPPGLPAGVIGRITHGSFSKAMGVTAATSDVQDLFRITRVSDTQYLSNGQTLDFDVRTEVVQVAGGDDVTFTVDYTVYGPMQDDELALSWAGPGVSMGDVSRGWLDVIEARTFEEFRLALGHINAPSVNVHYGDSNDNIGIVTMGGLPLRQGSGRYPQDASTTPPWSGLLPGEQRPFLLNPASGIIVAANNILGHPRAPSRDAADGYRALRIQQLLDAKVASGSKLSMQDMRDVQLDVTNSEWQVAWRPLMQQMDPFAEGSLQEVWRERLAHFDGNLGGVNGSSATLAEFFVQRLSSGGRRLARAVFDLGTSTDTRCAAPANCTLLFRQLFSSSVRVADAQGFLGRRWEDLHRYSLDNQIFSGSLVGCFYERNDIAAKGNRFTPNVASTSFPRLTSGSGPSMRLLVDLATPLESTYMALPGGVSENAWERFSGVDFFTNFLQGWGDGDYFLYRSSGYDARYTLELTPP